MTTNIDIINQGLSLFTSTRVSTIAPPKTSVERFIAANYPQWRKSELTRHDWVFCQDYRDLTQDGEPLTGKTKKYRFLLPNDALRPIREKDTEWEQRGRFLFSAHTTLNVLILHNTDESEFDPAFVDVLAARVAKGSAQFLTKSNTKTAEMQEAYREAEADAKRLNAFTVGPKAHMSSAGDAEHSWLTSRWGGVEAD